MGEPVPPKKAIANSTPIGSAVVATPPVTFQDFWNLGYRRSTSVIPPDGSVDPESSLAPLIGTKADPRGKTPGAKNSAGLWHGVRGWSSSQPDEAKIRQWDAMGASVGILTGDQGDDTSLIAIDADVLDEKWALQVNQLVVKHFGKGRPLRFGRYPKAIYLIRVRGLFPYSKVTFSPDGTTKERVELLSDGRQFVAAGVHPGTKKPYRWQFPPQAYESSDIFEAEKVEAFLRDLKELLPNADPIHFQPTGDAKLIDQEKLKGQLDHVREAVPVIPNNMDLAPDYLDLVKFGCAIKAALPDHPEEALDLYQGWAEKWVGPNGELNDPYFVESTFASLKPPFRIGASYLYDMAERHGGWTGGIIARGWWEPVDDAETPPADRASPVGEAADESLFPDPKPSKRFTFFSTDDALTAALEEAPEPLVDGLLEQGGMSVVYGASNTGKSLVGLSVSHAVAGGRDWAGMATAGMTVAYVAAEGGRGIKARIATLHQVHGPCERFFALSSPVDLFRADADLVPLIESIRALPQPVGMVVIDTLSRALAGGDENSSVDMGAFVRNMDRLRAAVGCHVALIHHTGKDAARGARGHSLLRAATDTEIEIAATSPTTGTIRVTKQRDLPGVWARDFRIVPHVVGVDPRGRVVSSAKVDIFEAAKPTGPGESAEACERDYAAAVLAVLGTQPARQFSDCLGELVAAFGKAGLSKVSSRPAVLTLMQQHLGGAGVLVSTSDGNIRIRLSKEARDKSPWIISQTIESDESASNEKEWKFDGFHRLHACFH